MGLPRGSGRDTHVKQTCFFDVRTLQTDNCWVKFTVGFIARHLVEGRGGVFGGLAIPVRNGEGVDFAADSHACVAAEPCDSRRVSNLFLHAGAALRA